MDGVALSTRLSQKETRDAYETMLRQRIHLGGDGGEDRKVEPIYPYDIIRLIQHKIGGDGLLSFSHADFGRKYT